MSFQGTKIGTRPARFERATYGLEGRPYHFTGFKKLGITGNCLVAEEFFYKTRNEFGHESEINSTGTQRYCRGYSQDG